VKEKLTANYHLKELVELASLINNIKVQKGFDIAIIVLVKILLRNF